MENINDYKLNPQRFYEVVSDGAIATLPDEEQINQKLFGISDEVLKKYYTAARRFFDEQQWQDCADAFTFLVFLNPYVYDFWICLGFSEQSQGKFHDAIVAYTIADAIFPEDPIAAANLFQCASEINEAELAEFYFEKAMSCCGDIPEYRELKQKLMQLK